ncbi:hypothetical protein LSH36_1285g00009 [Paralvinella palmiformis]|uniref:Peptidoglycan recognition protein family domain-containing protein n=1 Tax=Paralvinella palmiformis TaxID=53620 RepID=A0AAD9ITX2_9ANNE|nr:hypothetical protein LSH36_1285g00009 [Paralvinella palmiformis]
MKRRGSTVFLQLATAILFVLRRTAEGWDDIGYSFLVGEDGRVYEGRGWSTLPAHSPRYNFISHGICIMGNFMKVAPLSDALKAVEAWIQCGLDKRHIISGYELFGHRDGRCTDCPGDVLYGIIQTWPHYSHRHIPVICKGRDLGYSLCIIALSYFFSINFC